MNKILQSKRFKRKNNKQKNQNRNKKINQNKKKNQNKKINQNKNNKIGEEKILNELLINLTKNKKGVEIGGPSPSTGNCIYLNAEVMDNIIFSKNTVWSQHDNNKYKYFKNKEGNVFINDATELTNIENEKYDFLFGSHCLEHIANPIKALKEWLRIVKKDGYLILILPNKKVTFDHRRDDSKIEVLIKQYENNVGEDDLSTLNEILEKHDLSRDPPAGNLQQFKERSLKNYENRCLHHYVYSPQLLKELNNYIGSEYIYHYINDNSPNIWFIMKKL